MKKYLLLIALVSVHVHADWELIIDDTYQIASDGERLYAATEQGIYFSLDDGETWRRGDFKQPIGLLTGSPDAVYAYSYYDGILRSVSKGNTWHWKNNGFDSVWNGRRFAYPIMNQFFVASSGLVVAVCYHSGSWISRDRGDSWHDVTLEWTAPQGPGYSDIPLGTGIWSMGEFDGYLWAAFTDNLACRSPDEGATWEKIPYWGSGSIEQFDGIEAWLAFERNLYVAGHDGFGRWREHDLKWDNLSHGLPDEPALSSLAVHRNRIFAGSWRHGVFMFDHHSETWSRAGLSDRSIPKGGLVSHRGNLYAAAVAHGHDGIYRANLQFVTPENKAPTTWGAIKGNPKP